MASLTPRIDKLESSKNLIINGDFDFWQRGTNFVLTSNANYTADRWIISRSSGYGTLQVTTSQSSDVPTAIQSGRKSSSSIRMEITANQVASPNGTVLGFTQYIEGYNSAELYQKKITVSFWFKASIAGTYVAQMSCANFTHTYVHPFTYTAANQWEKISFTLDYDVTETSQNFTTGRGLTLTVVGGTGTNLHTANTDQWLASQSFYGVSGMVDLPATLNAYMQISQVYVGVAETLDIVFQRAGKTIQEELAMCQRYFFDPMYSGSTEAYAGAGMCFSATSSRVVVAFPVSMRSSPTLSVSSAGHFSVRAANGALVTATVVSLDVSSPANAAVNITVASGLVAGNATLMHRNTALGQMLFASEL